MKNIIFSILILISALSSSVFAEEDKDWKEYKRQHFIIYYKNAPIDFVKEVEDMSEYYYTTISKNIGFTRYNAWTWDERAKIYIYDNPEDYVETGKQMRWSHGVASPEDRVIRTFPAAHGFFDSTLPHELSHIVFREFVGFNARVPAWFEEGVAMYQEKAKRWGAHDTVRRAIENGVFISLEELTRAKLFHKADKAFINLFYAEAASAVNFMITKHGKHRFVNLCRKMKKGSSFEEALKSVYVRYHTIEDLSEDWYKFLTQ